MEREAPPVDPATSGQTLDINIVAVHGVGAPEAGSLLPGLLKAYARTPDADEITFAEVRLTTKDGHAFSGLTAVYPSKSNVTFWDANWSGLERAPEGWAARIPFLARLLIATVAYAGGEASAVRPFQVLFATVLLWLPILPALSLWSMVLVPWWAFFLVSVAISGGSAYLTWQIYKVDPDAIKFPRRQADGGDQRATDNGGPLTLVPLAFGAGCVWTAVPLALFVASTISGRAILEPEATGSLGTGVQAGVTLAIPITFLIALARGRREGMTWATHLSRIGLLALSTALVTTAAAVVLWANLFLADKLIESPLGTGSPFSLARGDGFKDWNAGYARALPYRIAAAEALTTGATALIGTLLILAVVGYGILTVVLRPSWSGAVLRGAVRIIIWLAVFVFAGTSLLIGGEVLDREGFYRSEWLAGRVDWAIETVLVWLPRDADGRAQLPADADILAVYGWAAIRALPFVGGLALGPVRTTLDVMADILHYLHRPERQRAPLRALLKALGDHADALKEEEGRVSRIVVVGHSQGSRVAVDTIFGEGGFSDRPGRLATTGSPISTLYGRFLGASDVPNGTWRWANFWRGSDFVGGAIADRSGVPTNILMPENYLRTHLNYWDEPRVMAWLLGKPFPEAPAKCTPSSFV